MPVGLVTYDKALGQQRRMTPAEANAAAENAKASGKPLGPDAYLQSRQAAAVAQRNDLEQQQQAAAGPFGGLRRRKIFNAAGGAPVLNGPAIY